MRKPVLVLGGGIAGIQASLDLAEMGIPVFLVEKSPSIGGRMAQLDKTFPTNDCSACILAPKVTACYNHPLIKTFSWSELLELKGNAPDFSAVVKVKARYIDEEACKGCSDCTLKCPIEVKSEFEMGMGGRKAIYKPFAQAVPNKVTIDKKGTSPCKFACPAHINAHGYIALTGQGRYEEALELVRKVTPFAGVLGRVCFHPCESECSRQHVDSPIAVASIKRFIADYEIQQGKTMEVKLPDEKKKDKIAVIGAGPAGLNCAYKLAGYGYPVTVFEALPQAGGMLRYGIPDYRLNKGVLDGEIKMIESMGVEIKFNTPIGENLTFDDLRQQGYRAFFLGVGAHNDWKLGIEGEELKGVIPGIQFLRELNMGRKPAVGKKVLVIGGGNVAMDVARSAVRLGCDVTVVYRRAEEQMPASPWEIEHAREEGVKFEFLTAPVEVDGENGCVTGLRCIRNRLGKKDASGRRRPEKIAGSEFVLEADNIIPAIGQAVDDGPIQKAGGPEINKKGTITCNIEKMVTTQTDIFAGGDAVSGPATMIEAIAAGNMAAESIRNYLENTDNPIRPFMLPKTKIEDIDFDIAQPSSRAAMNMIPMEKRKASFEEVELGFTEEQAKNEALRCVDCSICSECMACVSTCQSNAVRHDQRDEIIELDVSAVILANGYDVTKNIPAEFGYGRYKDVVTSMEYERILSASGPYKGHVQRPSDGKAPERIAFIQCVGSRDKRCDAEYCSSVCCMYAVKEAIITKEHLPSVRDIDIFNMDIRAYGKDFDKYIDSAENKYGIGFIRSRISGIERRDHTGKLIVSYCDEAGERASGEYDMVVLSVGMIPKEGFAGLLQDVGIKTDRYGFCWVNEMSPPMTSKYGVSVCGAASGPKDIPETVIEASAAASEASKIAFATPGDTDKIMRYFEKEEPVEMRDVSKEPVRTGVFVCHCGVNIGGYVDVNAVVEYAKTLPFVEYADQNLYTCSVDAQKLIAEKIVEYKLNRVVVASCTPRTHEPLFQSVLMKAGLNPYLFTMANIRDQCSWVHMDRWDDATQKAKDLVRMAVGRVIHAKQLEKQKVEVTKSALVLGGGVAGMTAALEIAGMGYGVHLVEKSPELGGNARKLNASPTGRYYEGYINEYVDKCMNNPLIDVHLNTQIKQIDGYVGKYSSVLKSPEGESTIEHGVVIVATGAREHKPSEYLYGSDERVLTQLELEEYLKLNVSDAGKSTGNKEKGKKWNVSSGEIENAKNIVMIQCVGSRDENRPYCSRVCCNQAIKNALIIRQRNPEADITVLYRDIRSYGFNELSYKKARSEGIRFVRYTPEKKPVVCKDGEELSVNIYEPLLDMELSMKADLIVLGSAIEPAVEDNKKIAGMLKVPLNAEGFFLEAHVKLRPVDFATDGVFVCGLAHAPKNIRESIVQGKAAAARAATVISKDMLETEGTVASVDETLCTACGTCEQVCAYKAVSVEEVERRGRKIKKAVVNAVLCKGCGTCSANCRCGAIDLNGFSDRQVISEINAFLSGR
jgi:heterodisulfide reductase subunit A-like polyferredoxin